MRVTEKGLKTLVDAINRLTDSPMETYTMVPGRQAVANVGNYHLSFAYGGVSLLRIVSESGGCTDVFEIGHVPKRELAGQMRAFIYGLETSKGK